MEISLEKAAVNIDTVAFSFRHAGSYTAKTRHSQFGSPSSIKTWSKRKTDYIQFPGREGRHAIIAMIDHDKRRTRIEGSPYAHRLGQNVHTGIDLNRACRLMLARMMENPQAPEWLTDQVWNKAELERVDIAVNFQFSSNLEVRRILDQLGVLFVLRRRRMKRTMTSVYWTPERKKTYSIALYAKGDELQDSKDRMRTVSPLFARMVQDCQGILRVEVRLYKPELKREGLTEPSVWSLGKPRDVFCKYFKRLPIANLIQEPISHEEIKRIGKLSTIFLMLHRSGIPLDMLMSQKTISRRIGELNKLGITHRGIAISKKYVKSADVLSSAPIAKPSSWLIKNGCVPRMRKLRPKNPSMTKKKQLSNSPLL